MTFKLPIRKIAAILSLSAGAVFWFAGTPGLDAQEPPNGDCVTCTPYGCYDNFIGVWDCEATLCGSSFTCEQET